MPILMLTLLFAVERQRTTKLPKRYSSFIIFHKPVQPLFGSCVRRNKRTQNRTTISDVHVSCARCEAKRPVISAQKISSKHGDKDQNIMQKLSLQKQSENASETLHVREPLTMQTFYALSEVNPAQTSLEDAYCIRMGLFNAMVNYTQRNSM